MIPSKKKQGKQKKQAKLLNLKKSGKPAIKITFPFNRDTLNKVKTIPGRKFHNKGGYNKYWTAPKSVEAVEKLKEYGFDLDEDLLDYLDSSRIETEELSETVEIPGLKGTLFPFQAKGVNFLEKRNGNALIADEMGCIDGGALIPINRGGGSKKVTLEKVYRRFNQQAFQNNYNWDRSIPTYTRSLCEDGYFRLKEIIGVYDKGLKKCLKVSLTDKKELYLTPDHRVRTEKGWVEIQKLNPGDVLYTNGQKVCKICEGEENIISHKYARYKGYCKTCMYKILRNENNSDLKDQTIGNGGYVMCSAYLTHHPNQTTTGIPKHRLVMEAFVNNVSYKAWRKIIKYNNFKPHYKFLSPKQIVHHKDGNKQNNNLSNLKLTNPADHMRMHDTYKNFSHLKHKKTKIKKIEKGGKRRVYDITVKETHNFTANGIVVHNCGKTIQALAWIQKHPKKRPVIIVVPASLKLNWKKEAESWMPEPNVQILSGTDPNQLITGDILIINYRILNDWKKKLKELSPEAVIFDEVHYAKNSKSKRTKASKYIAKYSKHVIGLTGTPVVNRPAEIMHPIRMIDKSVIPSTWHFLQTYCDAKHNGFGWDFSGASNTKELHKKLTSTVMLRRKKKEVLKDLPDKMRSFIPIELNNRKEYDYAEKEFIDWVRQKTEKDLKEEIRTQLGTDLFETVKIDQKKLKQKKDEQTRKASAAEGLVKIEHLKQLAVKGKLDQTIRWIKNHMESEGKLVVFAVHKFVVNRLMEEFGDIAVKIDGSVSGVDRNQAVEKFQKNNKVRLFVGNIQAAGVGLTLTAASTMAFLEMPWSPGDVQQAEDRIHIIGQENSCTYYFLLAKDTIEEKNAKLLDKKRKILDSVLDGEETEQQSLLAELMSEYKKTSS